MTCRRRPSDPGFDDECRKAKRSVRRLERASSGVSRAAAADPSAVKVASAAIAAVSMLNVAARIVCISRKYDRISPLLRDLHWLRVPERIKFHLAVLVFRCRNQTAPEYLARELYSGPSRSNR